jgi:hypothetical protein
MIQITKPIFHTNPLKILLNNKYSGTTNIQNLIQINKIYEIMRESILQENNLHNQNQQQQTINNMNLNGSVSNYNINSTNNNNINPNQSLNIHGNSNIFTIVKPNNVKLFMTEKGQKIFNIIKDNKSEQVINLKKINNLY